jgi:ribose transport system permease protein
MLDKYKSFCYHRHNPKNIVHFPTSRYYGLRVVKGCAPMDKAVSSPQDARRTRTWVAKLAAVPRVYWALLGLLLLLAIISPRSAEPANLLNLSRQGALLGVVALGQTIVMISGGLDLSVGSTVILSDVLAAQLIAGREERVVPVVLLVLAIGALIGLANGLLITRFQVTPFIATLGMSFIVYGAALIVSGGAPRGDIPPSMRFWGNGFLFGTIPALTVIWLGLAMIAFVLLRRTVLGRRLVALGANKQAARLSGVRVNNVTLLAYVISGFTAAAGGLLLVAYVGVGTLEVGTDYLLSSIAASVIGGTPFEGGRGTIWGTVGGALFLAVVYSILTVLNLPISGRRIVEGLIILAALALYARSRD